MEFLPALVEPLGRKDLSEENWTIAPNIGAGPGTKDECGHDNG
jgi:hypothetical protein